MEIFLAFVKNKNPCEITSIFMGKVKDKNIRHCEDRKRRLARRAGGHGPGTIWATKQWAVTITI
jgi:hypothetical protein